SAAEAPGRWVGSSSHSRDMSHMRMLCHCRTSRSEDVMRTADAFRIVPIILPDGRSLQQPVGVRVYQVRGGLHHGERGTYADLYDRFGRDNPNLVRDGEPHTVAEDGTDLLPVNVHLVLAGEESIVLRRLARQLGTSAPELLG